MSLAGPPFTGPPLEGHVDLTELTGVGRAADPDAVGLVSRDDTMTWRELDEAATRLASGYRSVGLSSGDRVATLMPNRTMLIVHYLACFRAGLVATPLNYRYTASEIDHALEVSDAAALVMHAERTEDVASSRRAGNLAVGVITIGSTEGADDDRPGSDIATTAVASLEALVETSQVDLEPTPGPDAPAVIFFTSGSTGPAKGVTHSVDSLSWMISGAAAAFEMTPDDVILPGSSMSHIGSFMWALAAISVGARVVVARTFDAGEILPLLRDQRPTVLAMIPAALTALLRDHDTTAEDFASLRLVRCGADKVSMELEHQFSHLVGFLIDEGYGMSEVGLATLNPPSGEMRPGSIGRPIHGVAIDLRPEDGGDAADVPVGDVGRIWIRTRSTMTGYWGNPDATAEVMLDGWLDSGDLARADEDGYLWFFGRKKQIIVHDGSNISPFEVEGALADHPAVDLVGVVGIHDETHGENVRAYVTLVEGAAVPTAQDLVDFARTQIGYKAPEEIVFLDEMPLNPTGKIDRVGLKRLAEEHLHPHMPG